VILKDSGILDKFREFLEVASREKLLNMIVYAWTLFLSRKMHIKAWWELEML
jgi:hypothetical protein